MKSKSLLYFILFFIIIGSACFQFYINYPIIGDIFSLLSKIVFFCVFLFYINFCVKNKVSPCNKIDILIFVYFSIIGISSIRNGNTFLYIFPAMMKIYSIKCLLVPDLYNNENKSLKVLSVTFIFIIALNLFLMIFMPNVMGFDRGNLVYLISSNHNQFGGVYFPAIILSLFAFTKDAKNQYFLFTVCLISMMISRSTTTFICLLIMLGSYIFRNNKVISKLIVKMLYICIPLFIFSFIIPYFFLDFNNIVERITTSMNKDITFTGRAMIWDFSLKEILKHIWFGVGLFDSSWASSHIHGINCHNLILNILLQGGIVNLTVFIYMAYLSVRNLKFIGSYRQKNMIIISLLLFFLMSQFEVYNPVFIIVSIYLCYLSPYIFNNSTNRKNDKLFSHNSSLQPTTPA